MGRVKTMGTKCVPSKTLWQTLKLMLQMGIFVFSEKETGAKSVAMTTT